MSDFSIEEDGDHRFKVRRIIKDDPDWKYYGPICVLFAHSGGNGNPYFKIAETHPDKYKNYIGQFKFGTKEEAADFAVKFITKAEEISSIQPLPADIVRYLEDRENYLRKEEEHALEEFHRIRRERYMLREMAQRNQISNIDWSTQWIDREKIVNDLLTFKVYVKFGEDDEEKMEHLPLISEAALYELIGKEDARTVLSMVNNICNMLAPNIVANT